MPSYLMFLHKLSLVVHLLILNHFVLLFKLLSVVFKQCVTIFVTAKGSILLDLMFLLKLSFPSVLVQIFNWFSNSNCLFCCLQMLCHPPLRLRQLAEHFDYSQPDRHQESGGFSRDIITFSHFTTLQDNSSTPQQEKSHHISCKYKLYYISLPS